MRQTRCAPDAFGPRTHIANTGELFGDADGDVGGDHLDCCLEEEVDDGVEEILECFLGCLGAVDDAADAGEQRTSHSLGDGLDLGVGLLNLSCCISSSLRRGVLAGR